MRSWVRILRDLLVECGMRLLVESEKCGNWRVYRLPQKRSGALKKQLSCLQECAQEEAAFQADLKRLRTVAGEAKQIADACCKA